MQPLTYEEFVAEGRAGGEGRVLVDRLGDRAVVRLNDPEKLNPLNGPLTVRLLDELQALAADPEIRSVILTGADPAFSAGGDLRAMRDFVHPAVDDGPDGAVTMWRWIRYHFGGVVRTIARTDKTFVAAVNGACAGVGLAFALACDLVIASERARFLTAFGKIGLLPEVGTSHFLTRRIGYQRAFELFVSGRVLSGREAAEMGITNEVVPHEHLLSRAHEWCDRVADLPAHAVAMTKPLLRGAQDMSWEHALAMEEFAEPLCFTTDAHRDGVSAMLKNWEG